MGLNVWLYKTRVYPQLCGCWMLIGREERAVSVTSSMSEHDGWSDNVDAVYTVYE